MKKQTIKTFCMVCSETGQSEEWFDFEVKAGAVQNITCGKCRSKSYAYWANK